MKAWRVHEFGPHGQVLRWEDREEPRPPKDGVVLEVSAAGVNFPDLLAIAGKYQVKADLPFTPGIEAVGTVLERGAESPLAIGDRVIASAPYGAFAEKLAAPANRIYSCPNSMSDHEAAGFLITYQTAYFALLHRAHLRAGEVLLVHGGAGGVGSAAIQLGRALGATVIATAGGPEKVACCLELGAHHAIDYEQDDFAAKVNAYTDGHGADVIYDPVGGDVFDRSTKCIALGGRLLVIGFASGRIPEIATNRILLKNISVVGLYWGNYQREQPELVQDAHEALCERFASGQLAPLVHATVPMSRLPEALDRIQRRESRGKIVVTNSLKRGQRAPARA